MNKIVFERNINKWSTDAFNSIVVKEDDGTIRKARMLGGYVSRSGMTAEPWLVEKGSIKALRIDAWVGRLRELGSCRLDSTYIVFTGHGTKFDDVQEINEEEAIRCLKDWKTFRLDGVKIPKKEDYKDIELVFKAIRQITKRIFMSKEDESFYLTYDEVLGIGDEIKIEFDEQGNVLSGETKNHFCGKDAIGWWCIKFVRQEEEEEEFILKE